MNDKFQRNQAYQNLFSKPFRPKRSVIDEVEDKDEGLLRRKDSDSALLRYDSTLTANDSRKRLSVSVETNDSFNLEDLERDEVFGDDKWVKCRETESGATIYYNKETGQLGNPSEGKEENEQELDRESKDGVDDILIAMATILDESKKLLLTSQDKEMDGSVKKNLQTILSSVQQIQDAVKNETEEDDRDMLETCLDLQSLRWDFDNDQVKHYRARARTFSHKQYLPRVDCVPLLFSTLPIVSVHDIKCIIQLPSTVAKVQSISSTIRESDTAESMIKHILEKYSNQNEKHSLGDPSLFSLKACGRSDYMSGAYPMSSFEYIRTSIRQNITAMELQLVPNTHIVEGLENPKTLSGCEDLFKKIPSYTDKPASENPLSLDAFTEQFSHQNWEEVHNISLSELEWQYRIRILGLDELTTRNLPRLLSIDPSISEIYVRTFLFYGSEIVAKTDWQTDHKPVAPYPRWSKWLSSAADSDSVMCYNKLPRATRAAFLVYAASPKLRIPEILGWATCNLIDEIGEMRRGVQVFNLWPLYPDKVVELDHNDKECFDFIFRGSTRDNRSRAEPASITVEFESFAMKVVAPVCFPYRDPDSAIVGQEIPYNQQDRKKKQMVDFLVHADPLYKLTDEDRALIWEARHHLLDFPSVLTKFLQSIDWCSPDHIHEAHRLLPLWKPPDLPGAVIELLDVKYHDHQVRRYAVERLRSLKDDELQLFLLQLTQAIKFEPYHDSPLVRFLMERALQNPLQVGHYFFWHLKAELHEPLYRERFTLILEEYLHHCGTQIVNLYYQCKAVQKLQGIAALVVTLKNGKTVSDPVVMDTYTRELEKLNDNFFSRTGAFQIPLNPRIDATTLIVEKCQYMSSKKKPLWLAFNNADTGSPPKCVIFKSGDDLRQDMLTLQLLRVMDRIWLANGLDLRMKPYAVLATGVNSSGEGVGMIEVVIDSDTISGIQQKYGGAHGALKNTPLIEYLEEHNEKGEKLERAIENFVYSCAGYCVATYVLGIGDRHLDNIMITKNGYLFHIDFGHFLGNVKYKWGLKRERTRFVLTPEMAYIMGGKKYKRHPNFRQFQGLCEKALNILRHNASELINLFVVMIAAEMPELRKEGDVEYLKEMLHLDESDRVAGKLFAKEIDKSLSDAYKRVDNWIHNQKHYR